MKTLGIIGGLAPATTIDYYRLIVDGYRAQRRDGSYPSILINSIDLSRLILLVTQSRLPELTEWLSGEINRLARAGADFGLISSNTPHVVFDELSRLSPIPLLSMVEAAAEVVQEMGLKSVGLLGTRYTMQGRFYPDAFRRRGIEVRPPAPADIEYVHDKYMGELINENFLPETREGVHAVIGRLKQEGMEAVLLAGTELTLLLRNTGDQGVPLLDTTHIHVRRAVAELLS
jgi:aspartate racemase